MTTAGVAAFPLRPGDSEEDGDQGHAVLDPIPTATHDEPSLRGVDYRDAGGQDTNREEGKALPIQLHAIPEVTERAQGLRWDELFPAFPIMPG
ncbi:MAG: hypothetical protein SH809_04590 [Rhodothermales bacterium]|nr:hypothetical protein [Rhodothermales bacterium]